MINKHPIKPTDIKSLSIGYKQITQKRIGTPQGVPYFEKRILSLDSKGEYVKGLFDELKDTMPKPHLNEGPKSVLLNIGVGRGKTTSLYAFIEYLYRETDHIIVMASPFKALVEKDYNELTQGDTSVGRNAIPDKDIVNYQEVKKVGEDLRNGSISKSGMKSKVEKLAQKRIHIISVNSLMSNPGTKHYFASGTTKFYLKSIRDHIQRKLKDRRAYMFFDELHESVHNFTNVYLYNLFKWDGLITNLYISSATFTESSLEVVTYLTWLSKNFVRLLELPRSKYPSSKQSRLHLVCVSGYFSSNNNEGLNAIREIIESEGYERFHILSYNKGLIKSMAENEFYEKYNPNLCVSGEDNRFETGRVNMGTNFKTGVNVPSGEPLFIIIPPNYASIDRETPYGIFTDGEPAILQALARVRANSSVYVIIPQIDSIIDDAGHTKSFVKNHQLEKHLNPANIDKPLPRKAELFKILEAYEKIFHDVFHEINQYVDKVNDHAWFPEESPFDPSEPDKRPKIKSIKKYFDHYGTYKRPVSSPLSHSEFVLKEGQSFLVFSELSSGKKIYPFILWAALNDQFTNCTLTSIIKYFPPTVELSIDPTGDYFTVIKDFIENKTDLQLSDLSGKKVYDAFLLLKELLLKKKIEVGGQKQRLRISLVDGKGEKNSLEPPAILSNATFWKCILSTTIELCSNGKKVGLDKVEDYYMNQRLRQSKFSKGNSLENAYVKIRKFSNEFMKKNGLSNPIMPSKYSKNKSGFPKRKDLTPLLDAMKAISKEDELYKMPAFTRFSKKNENQAYNFFTKNILELGNRLGAKEVRGLYPIKGIRFRKEKPNQDMF